MKGFGQRLAKARIATGMSQNDLAYRVGLKSWSNVRLWETDQLIPSANNIRRICLALNVSADWLLDCAPKTAPNL